MLNGFSYHADSKKKANEELNREIGVINEEEVNLHGQGEYRPEWKAYQK